MNHTFLSDDNFRSEVVLSETPVLIDFMLPWYGPCRTQAALLAEFAESREGSLKLCSVDTDEQPRLAHIFGVDHLPTLILFRGGLPSKISEGIQNMSQLENMLT